MVDLLTKNVRALDSAGYDVVGWDVEWNFSYKTGSLFNPDSMHWCQR
jgi:hypothetical protein